MPRFAPLLLAGAALALIGCSPALDWREFQPEGSGVLASFPCKPDRHSRAVKLEVQAVRMEMLVCDAGDAKFALAFFDVAEPGQVSAALSELQALAAGNLGAQSADAQPAVVPGMTPNPKAMRLRIEGRQPDGATVQEQAVFFAKGLRIYQAMVLGRRVSAEAADTFLGGLRLPA